jgi:hypothetical protein
LSSPNKVDIFYLGSELEGLTGIKYAGREFPFAGKLVELSDEVRSIIGLEAKISYAANWTEYHSCRGGYRPLDALWSAQNINFVGIDYYMPLTDTKNHNISVSDIEAGFTRGEGKDYYYMEGEKIPLHDEHQQWKNIEYWVGSQHWAWDPEAGESYKTSWTPNSKPVIFSEFGFRSIDMATNTPNVHGIDLPKHSSGSEDYPLQIKAIRATLSYIQKTPAVNFGFCYCWDSRGYGWQNKYDDGNEWAKGHWIDGKIKNR